MNQLIKTLHIEPTSSAQLEDLIRLALMIAKKAQTYVYFYHNKSLYHIDPNDKIDKNNLDKFRVK